MFSQACRIAGNFTKPVVMSRLSVGGACESGCGSFVVLNEDGWVVTAHHIVQQIGAGIEEAEAGVEYTKKKAEIDADPAANKQERRRRLQALRAPGKKSTQHFSAWWGMNEPQLVEYQALPTVDLAVGRLEPFNKDWISQFPVFKDPTNGVPTGVSVCKLGYAFAEVESTWDDSKKAFSLGANTQLALFPIEGMITRHIGISSDAPPPGGIPETMIETSSPGLRGQSGGPTFDTHGTVWAIQSRTVHLPLGFDPEVPGTHGVRREHQFLNVGWGASVETIVPFLRHLGVDFQLAQY